MSGEDKTVRYFERGDNKDILSFFSEVESGVILDLIVSLLLVMK